MEPQAVQISFTCGSEDEGHSIAKSLVEHKLAACVQVSSPIKSIYRWKDKIETDDEWYCVVKTTKRHYSAVEKHILEMHSYEMPEIIATPIIMGSRAYLDWLRKETA